ncbi:uncharacterized protein LOC117566579 [Drosophila albomicans]|uniref:Uncharacterized protein LOC117566579 n=1 Tax=Drosophila albomicans TaxID=7291 RepID=A0A6P8XX82_DROAB|nr:uncharacterized protein LOC117566579 [Drosophila albomicans]
MNNLALLSICCVAACCYVEAAFEDFVVRSDSKESVHSNDLAFGCDADNEEHELIASEDMLVDGAADSQLLLRLLMQHAQRLGVSVEQLAKMHSMQEGEPFDSEMGCSAAEPASYGQEPSWYDVFFN